MIDFLGPIISGLALMWAIYSFILKKRDEEFSIKQGDIKKLLESQEKQIDKEFYNFRSEIVTLKKQIATQEKAYHDLKLVTASLLQQTKNQGQQFNDTTKRIEKVLDRHEAKLDNFGNVIIKD